MSSPLIKSGFSMAVGDLRIVTQTRSSLLIGGNSIPDFLDFPIPVCGQANPDTDCGGVNERESKTNPESVKTHITLERKPDSKWNTCGGHCQ